ncbi:hypothetical protein HDU84_000545 [Entophlyctis sp. JEL0112]|nr:hypothetical protein HDU84_000545 [Entophlyctis sp. JEL0112]
MPKSCIAPPRTTTTAANANTAAAIATATANTRSTRSLAGGKHPINSSNSSSSNQGRRPSVSKKLQLLDTVREISRALDAGPAAETVQVAFDPISQDTAFTSFSRNTERVKNPQSIFLAPSVFENSPGSQMEEPQQLQQLPQIMQPAEPGEIQPRLSLNTSLLKESVKNLEQQNRRLHFDKAALVNTLIDIKPSNQPMSGLSPFARAEKDTRPPQKSIPRQQYSDAPRPQNTTASDSNSISDQVRLLQQQLQQQHFQNDNLAHTVRRQSLDIESLTSQTAILAAENKRLRARALDLESYLLASATQTPALANTTAPLPPQQSDADQAGKTVGSAASTAAACMCMPLVRARTRQVAQRRALVSASLGSCNSAADTSWDVVSTRAAVRAVEALGDAFAAAVTLPGNDTDGIAVRDVGVSAEAPLHDALTALDAAIVSLQQSRLQQPTARDTTDDAFPDPKMITDLATLYIGEMDAHAAFRQDVRVSMEAIKSELESTRRENLVCIRAAEADKALILELREKAEKASAALEARKKADETSVTVNFEDFANQMKRLETENSRLKGVEISLEGIIAEWKSENETLRRMVDELSGFSQTRQMKTPEMDKLLSEMHLLKALLEDEKLKNAKAKEVIAVLKTSIRSDVLRDADLDFMSATEADEMSGKSRPVFSPHLKALHETVGRSLVDLDELVKVIAENNEVKRQMSELSVKFSEQEKCLSETLSNAKQLKDVLSRTELSSAAQAQAHEAARAELQSNVSLLREEAERLRVEASNGAEAIAGYATQFGRTELLAAEWVDIRTVGQWGIGAEVSSEGKAVRRAIHNFEGLFLRMVDILKDSRQKLKDNEDALRSINEQLQSARAAEAALEAKLNTHVADVEKLSEVKRELTTRVAELEKSYEVERATRKATDSRMKRIIKGSLALLEIPVDDALFKKLNLPASPAKHNSSSFPLTKPSRDIEHGLKQACSPKN